MSCSCTSVTNKHAIGDRQILLGRTRHCTFSETRLELVSRSSIVNLKNHQELPSLSLPSSPTFSMVFGPCSCARSHCLDLNSYNPEFGHQESE